MLLRLKALTKSNRELVGLDLGTDSLKLLEINSVTSKRRIIKFAVADIPEDIIVKNEIKDPNLIADIIKSTFRQADIQTKNVALAIPRSSTILKNINIDKRLNDEEIETRAWIEANHHFPDLVGDSYLDFAITGVSPQDPNQLELILVACRKEVIKPYLEIIKNAGLNLQIVDINSFALERSLSLIAENTPELTTIALLNLDLALSTLIVLHNKKLIYAHDESFEGLRLKTQLQEASGNEIKQQEIMKESLTAYLRHSMNFFYTSRPNIRIEKIYLSGDCALQPCLMPFIQQEIGVPMEIANLLQSLEIGTHINEPEIKKYSPALALCAGLALSSID